MNIGRYIQMYSEDLKLKNYAKSSIENYCSQVSLFLNYFNDKVTKPSEINERDIKDWILLGNSINSRKHRISAVKLFYQLTGKQPLKFKHIPYPKKDKKLPIVLSVAEIQKMFTVCENLKHKAILSLLYSTGLRVSELINLKWKDIDRSRMIINVIGGKGMKDRQLPLNQVLIDVLAAYYKEYKSVDYVFNGQNTPQYSDRTVLEVVKQLAVKAGINKRVYTHLIRHCTMTHLVEQGLDINIIQRLCGHSNVKTTATYLHISHNLISSIQSPLNAIKL
jgi:integrase/recombinase XerD